MGKDYFSNQNTCPWQGRFSTRGKLMGGSAAGSARAAACSGLRPRCPVAGFTVRVSGKGFRPSESSGRVSGGNGVRKWGQCANLDRMQERISKKRVLRPLAEKRGQIAGNLGGQVLDLNIFHKFPPDFLDFSEVSGVTEELICREMGSVCKS